MDGLTEFIQLDYIRTFNYMTLGAGAFEEEILNRFDENVRKSLSSEKAKEPVAGQTDRKSVV